MKLSTKTIATVGMFTAVLGILSIITIPMPTGVPVTLQTFAMALCGFVLGWKLGLAATALYLVLGTAGIPIFAGMSAGPGVLFGYTGGFLWGFLFLTAFCGMGLRWKNMILRGVCGMAGLTVCHLLGALWYGVLADLGLAASLAAVSLPYLAKDVISVACACAVGAAVRRALRAGRLLPEPVKRRSLEGR